MNVDLTVSFSSDFCLVYFNFFHFPCFKIKTVTPIPSTEFDNAMHKKLFWDISGKLKAVNLRIVFTKLTVDYTVD